MEPAKSNGIAVGLLQRPNSNVGSSGSQRVGTGAQVTVKVKADAGTGVGVGVGGVGVGVGALVGGRAVDGAAGTGMAVGVGLGLTWTSTTLNGQSSSSAVLPARSVARIETRWSPTTGTESVRL